MFIPGHASGITFLIVSDTHDSSPLPQIKHVDVLLHCGDITESGGIEAHQRAIEAIANVDAELKLVIPGNHDLDLDPHFIESYRGLTGQVIQMKSAHAFSKEDSDAKCFKIGPPDDTDRGNPGTTTVKVTNCGEPASPRSLWLSRSTLGSNIHLLAEGTHAFTLENGATFKLYASPITPSCGVWAFQRPSREDRFNASGSPIWAENTSTQRSVIPDDADIVMTHGPPKYILDDVEIGANAGCEHLARALHRVRPLLHAFGHIHPARGVRRVLWEATAASLPPLEKSTPSRSRKCPHTPIESSLAENEAMPYTALPQEFIGQNSSRRAGFSRISSINLEDKDSKTLFVNAAVGNNDGVPGNVPFLVEICK